MSDDIKPVKLNENNWNTWKFNIKMYLMGKDLWGLADGSEVLEVRPANSAAEARKFLTDRFEEKTLSKICYYRKLLYKMELKGISQWRST